MDPHALIDWIALPPSKASHPQILNTTKEPAGHDTYTQPSKGLTKRTLCGIVLFKLDTIFFICFACQLEYFVLILHIPAYLGIKGDQIFSHSKIFFCALFCTNWITPICSILFDLCYISFSGSFVISLSSCILQRLSTVTLNFLAFLPKFSSSLQCHAEVVSWTAGERGSFTSLAWIV